MVSFDDDSDNIDIALKIKETIDRHSIDFDYKIFVRIRKDNYRKSSHVAEILKNNGMIAYGTESDIINHENIVNENLDHIAQTRNAFYMRQNPEEKRSDLELWKSLNYNRKLSNRYSSSSIRFKLNLMGLDLSSEEKGSIDIDNYLTIYDSAKTIKKDENNEIIYTLADNKMIPNPRQVLTFIEHERWNAFYLFRGYMPMAKASIEMRDSNKGFKLYKDDDKMRLHACLTTLGGLDEYRILCKNVYKKNDIIKNDSDTDVIHYDTQLMDNIFAELKTAQAYIVRVIKK